MPPTKPFVPISEQLAAAHVNPNQVRLPGIHATRGPRKERKASTRTVGVEEAVWTEGMFGGVVHRWALGVKADTSGWVSRCGKYSKSRLVEPVEGAAVCSGCQGGPD